MKKTLLAASGMVVLLLLIGQGCPKQNTVTEPENQKDQSDNTLGAENTENENGVDTTTTEKNEASEPAKETNADLTLKAEAAGSQQVRLSWSAPEGLTEANRFILVRDEKTNPEHSGKNFWLRQHHSKREVVWINVPTGTMHFRVCITENNQNDTCAKYSNDAAVTVE